MASVHRLPDVGHGDDSRRLVDMTWGELRALLADERRRLSDPDTQLMKPPEFAKLLGVAEKRVHEWCELGMPFIPTGDTKGKRIRTQSALAWLEISGG